MISKLKTIYFATPEFSIPVLELLSKNKNIDLKMVVSMPDRNAGRGQQLQSPAVIEYCKTHQIPFFQTSNINKEDTLIEQWRKQEIDLIIVLAFAQFLNQTILNLPRIGCFNIHTSLLPKYRGAAPIHYALLNGDKKTGVSIQKMVKKMDAGDICVSINCPIDQEDDYVTLSNKLKSLSAKAVDDLILSIIKNELFFTPQDETLINFAPTIKKEDGFILFENETTLTLKQKLNAFTLWPGIYFFINHKRLKIISFEIFDKKVPPGALIESNNKLLIGLKDAAIRLTLVQLEGKKVTSDEDFTRGYKEPIYITQPKDIT